MSTTSIVSRLFAGPVGIQVKDIKVINLPETEDRPARVVLVYNKTMFYMAPNRDGTSNGVGYIDGYPVRLVIDKVVGQKWVWNEEAADYLLTDKTVSRIYLELQDDYSTRDTTTYWLYYATLRDPMDDDGQRIVSCWPAQFSNINDADNVIAVLMVRGESNNSAYDFDPPCDTVVIEQTTAMTMYDVEVLAYEALMPQTKLTEDELEEQLAMAL